jgi:hypothetical protein
MLIEHTYMYKHRGSFNMKITRTETVTSLQLLLQLLFIAAAAAGNPANSDSCESACVGLADWAAQECAHVCRKPAAVKAVLCRSDVCAESLGCSTACHTEVGAAARWGQLRRLVEQQQQLAAAAADNGDIRLFYAVAALGCVVALLAALLAFMRSSKMSDAVSAAWTVLTTKKIFKWKSSAAATTATAVFTVERTASAITQIPQIVTQGQASSKQDQASKLQCQNQVCAEDSQASFQDQVTTVRGQTSVNLDPTSEDLGQISVSSSIHELGLPVVPPPCHPGSSYIYGDYKYRVYEDWSLQASYNAYISVI